MEIKGSTKKYSLLLFKGLAMGAADVVPGVSGGTIAFITGIYSELIESLRSFNLASLGLLFKGQISSFWKKINGSFLLALFSGILISIFSLARLMQYLLANWPVLVWSFFFGLVLVSGFIVLRKISAWNIARISALVSGIVVMVVVTTFTPAETGEAYWFIFIAGAIAICAMILPGISGAFILLILGKYQFILQAVSSLDLPVLAIFGAGVVTGLLSFANLLSWLLRRFHDITIALLSGFIIGSLNKIWPWKVTISSTIDSHGEILPLVQRNISPGKFYDLTGNDSMLIPAISLCIAAIILIVVLEQLASKNR